MATALFNVGHCSLFSRMLVLRLFRHKHDTCILIANRRIMNDFYKKVINEKLFDDLILYDPAKYRNLKAPKEIIMGEIDSYFSELLKKYPINDNTVVYTGGDLVNTFGLYAQTKTKKITLVESLQNDLDFKIQVPKRAHILNIASEELCELQEEYCTLNGLKNYEHIIFEKDSNYSKKTELECDYEYVDFIPSLKQLSAADKNKIKCICPNINELIGKNIVLMNSLGYMRGATGLNDSNIPYFYRAFIDLFCKNEEVILKKHPEDFIDVSKYTKYPIIDDFPIELLSSFIDQPIFEKSVCIDTSAGAVISKQKLSKSNVRVGNDFCSHIHIMPAFSFICDLAEKLSYRTISQTILSTSTFEQFVFINNKTLLVKKYNEYPDVSFKLLNNEIIVYTAPPRDYIINATLICKHTNDDSYSGFDNIKLTIYLRNELQIEAITKWKYLKNMINSNVMYELFINNVHYPSNQLPSDN